MSLLSLVRDAIDRRRTIRELSSFDGNDKNDHYWAFKNEMTEALELYDRGNAARAKEIWYHAYVRFPQQALASQAAVALLLKLRLFDELDSLLSCGFKQHPLDARLLAAYALVAYERGNSEEALLRCAKLRKKHPHNEKGYWIAAAALSQLNRPAEAEAIFEKAMKLLPKDAGLLIEYAKLAERRRDWGIALERWNRLFEMCKHLAGISGAATALAHLGRFDEADQLIASVTYRAGTDHLVWLASTRVAEIRGDWEEAARRWAIYRSRFPLLLAGYFEALGPLRQLGRDADVEAVLRDGLERFPCESKLFIEYAQLAHHRRDWEEAARRWAVVQARFPKNAEGCTHGAEALDALGRVNEAQEVRRRGPA